MSDTNLIDRLQLVIRESVESSVQGGMMKYQYDTNVRLLEITSRLVAIESLLAGQKKQPKDGVKGDASKAPAKAGAKAGAKPFPANKKQYFTNSWNNADTGAEFKARWYKPEIELIVKASKGWVERGPKKDENKLQGELCYEYIRDSTDKKMMSDLEIEYNVAKKAHNEKAKDEQLNAEPLTP